MSDKKSLSEQIEKMLQDDSLNHTLGKESLEKMLEELKFLNKKVKEQESSLDWRADVSRKLEQENDKLNSEISDLVAELGEFKSRELNLKLHEKDHLETTIRNEYERKRSEDLKETLGLFLRNTNYRQTLQTQVPVAMQPPVKDEYGVMQYSHVQTEDVKTTETKHAE